MIDKVKVKLLSDRAYLPERAHKEDAGFDLRTPLRFMIYPGDRVTINTEVCMRIPEGYVGFLKSKSGLNVKKGVISEGVIDAGYLGSIKVCLRNTSTAPVYFEKGDKISQLVILPIETPDLEVVDSFNEDTDRGQNGFGSSGQ